MGLLETLQISIGKIGIKEVARRTGLSASTISRVNSGQINPTLEVVEKISAATGLLIKLEPNNQLFKAPRLKPAENILGRLRNELKTYGVKHAVVFGSTARGEDQDNSDIDIYLDFGDEKIHASNLLGAEGLVLNAFGENKIDIVSRLNSPRGERLKKRIEEDGIYVF
jgi:predicted nucleotidyltransferase